MDMTNSMLSVGKEWTALIEDLIHVAGPIPGKNCTLSLLNPLTGSLEWLSVDCHQKYSISTLVCERVREEINIINVLFVDLTNYIELHETSFKDTRLLNSCPDQLYVMFCARGGFSLDQIINNKHNKYELPADQVLQFKILKHSRDFTGYYLLDKTPILSRLFEHACINKTYILLSGSYKKPYGSFAHIGKIPDYGHFALCPISIHMKRYERHLSQMSVSVVGIAIHAGLLSCHRGCIGLDNKCVCFDSVTHTTQTSLDQTPIFPVSKLLKPHGVCITTFDSLVHHYDCKNRFKEGRLTNILSTVTPILTNHTLQKTTVNCPFQLFQCNDKHCVSPLLIDDGNSDCPDGSDEMLTVCDSVNDCENCRLPECLCSHTFYQCPQGGCVLWDRVIDGKQDCQFGEDEIIFPNIDSPSKALGISPYENQTTPEVFICDKLNVSIPGEWVNDLIPDCPLSDDEPSQNHHYILNPCYPMLQCTQGHPLCFPVHGLCVYDHDQYGHLKYCRNGAHLGDCQIISCSGHFKCPSFYCVPLWKICDTVADCPYGEDENNCISANKLECSGFLRCKGGVCVHPLQICDGEINCPISRDDEYGCDNAQCPDSCDCLGAAISCYDDICLDVRNYKALFMMNVTSKSVCISNGASLYMLNISQNFLTEITSKTFHYQPNLVFLDLSSNKINYIGQNSFSVHLILLNLGGNHITIVESMAFQGLKSISILDLSHQNISNIYGILATMSLSVKLLNVSYNSIEWLNIPDLDKLSNLATLDLRHNPITRLSPGIANFTPNILIDINYICCFSTRFNCPMKPLESVCPLHITMYSITYIGISSCIVNVIHYVINRKNCKVRFIALLFLLKIVCNSIMGITAMLPLIKDVLFPPETVHLEQGAKYMYCFLTGTLQLFMMLYIPYLGFIKYLSTYLGATSMVKESSQQFPRKCVYLFVSFVLHICLSFIPSLISFKMYGHLPQVTQICSIFNGLNTDRPESIASMGCILCLTIIYSVTQVVCSCKTYLAVLNSHMAVKQRGGIIKGGNENKSKLILKCIIQPVISASLQITATTVCLVAISGGINDDILLGWLILLPSTMEPAL